MKICFISSAMDVNRGGGHYLASIMGELAQKHDVSLLVGESNMPENSRIKVVKIGLKSHHYYYGLQDYFFSKDLVCAFEDIHKKNNFDLIHANQVIGMPIIKLKKFGVPIVYTIHHPVSKDKAIAIKETQSIKERLRWWRRYFYLVHVQKKICRKLDNILTVSHASASAIADDYHISKSKIRVIYNGIDSYFFRNFRGGKEGAVISVGSFTHPRRGFPYLLDVYKKISQLADIEIWDVGRRTKEQQRLIAQIPHVLQLGVIDQEVLLNLYSRAKVHISCSLYEGFGFNSLEALASGAAAISFGVGGVTEVLQKVDPYLVVEPKNVGQMFEKVKFLLNDRNFEKRAIEYRDRVKKYFGLENIIPQFEQFYQELIYKNRHSI